MESTNVVLSVIFSSSNRPQQHLIKMFGTKKLSIAAVVVVFSFLLRLRVERELMSPKGLPVGQRREEEAESKNDSLQQQQTKTSLLVFVFQPSS